MIGAELGAVLAKVLVPVLVAGIAIMLIRQFVEGRVAKRQVEDLGKAEEDRKDAEQDLRSERDQSLDAFESGLHDGEDQQPPPAA